MAKNGQQKNLPTSTTSKMKRPVDAHLYTQVISFHTVRFAFTELADGKKVALIVNFFHQR